MKGISAGSALLILLLVFVLLGACGGGSGDSIPFGLKSEVVTNADRVKAMAFAPDGRIFFAEQFSGNIRIIGSDGQIQDQPFAHLDVATYLDLDWGLTGLALDPDFASNHYVYAFYSKLVAPGDKPTSKPALVRFTDASGRGTNQTTISEDFPATDKGHPGYNANGTIHFGPDGFLYLSIGDYDCPNASPDPTKCQGPVVNPDRAVQSLSNPIGKLLRVNKTDGSAAPGNPFASQQGADPRIFAYGFREPFDFSFHPTTKAIYGTDNTTVSCEELNIIEAGKDYGWPNVGEFPYADCKAGKDTQAIYRFAREGKQPGDFLSFVEVSALAFSPATKYPTLGDSLIVCESQISVVENNVSPGVLRRLVLGGSSFNQVTASDLLVKDCKRAAAVAPDGTIYYANNTEIRRLVASGEAPALTAGGQASQPAGSGLSVPSLAGGGQPIPPAPTP